MTSIFAIISAGIVATLFNITVVTAFVWRGMHHGEVLEALGIDMTHNKKNYLAGGIFFYVIIDMLLVPLYYAILVSFKMPDLMSNVGIGAFLGLIQGFVLTYVLVQSQMREHQHRQYRRFWLPITFTHLISHILFGTVLGGLIGSYILHGWFGLNIGCLAILIFTLLMSIFIRRGAHRQALDEQVEAHHHRHPLKGHA